MLRTGLYVVVILLLVAWAGYYATQSGILPPLDDPHAKRAPGFTLQSLDGTSVSLKQFRGKNVVLLDFWATWCPPCRAAMPELAALEARYGAKGLKVISINQRESRAIVQSFVQSTGYRPLVVLDSGSASRSYAVRSYPTFVLIDKSGRIRHSQSGFARGMSVDLARRIEDLL